MVSRLIGQSLNLSSSLAGSFFGRRMNGFGKGAIALSLSLFGAASLGTVALAQQTVRAQASQPPSTLISQAAVVSGAVVTLPDAPTPPPTAFAPVASGIVDLSARTDAIRSVGQLRPVNVQAQSGNPVGWLGSVVLPLYNSPGGEHWGWIYQGWLIPKGQTYLAIGRDASFAMVRAYENIYTFPVLEAREDGWFRVQYTTGGSAWAHASHLELGSVPLAVEGWETVLGAQSSLYFLNRGEAQALRSQPTAANNLLTWVPAGSLIEPLQFQDDWMQVRVTRPVSTCRPLAGATVSEGWMRWRGEGNESLVWYRPDGGCASE
jgi:hypothetical protein